MKDFFHFETKWKEARKMKNLRDTLFALSALNIEIGAADYNSLRYRRCFNLASALEDRIVEKWGRKK